MSVEVSGAIEALGRGDGADALARLLGTWRGARGPALGDAIAALGERLGDPVSVALEEVCAGTAMEAMARIQALERTPADPRVVNAVLGWLSEPPYHATASQPFWRSALKLLAAGAGPGTAEALKAALASAQGQIKGATMRAWLAKQAAALALAPGDDVSGEDLAAADRAALDEAIGRFEPAARAHAPRAPSSEEALLRAIRANPADDGPRAVYADWLLERGDPRGEFIMLQLERRRRALTAEEAKREMKLLRAGAKAWVGEPAAAMRYFTNLVTPGLPEELEEHNAAYFDRGFLARFNLRNFDAARIRKLRGHPSFATVEDLTCGFATEDPSGQAEFLADPSLRGLRRVLLAAELVPGLAETPHAGRIATVKTRRYQNDVTPVYEACARLPGLKRLVIVAVEPKEADRELARAWQERLAGARIEIASWSG